MSIVPGPETWRDAGLADVDPAALVEVDDDAAADVDVDRGGRFDADDADVAEQSIVLPPPEEDEYR